jgi:hypothetical protein
MSMPALGTCRHTRGAPLSTSSCTPPVVEAGRSATQRSGLLSRALHLALAVPAPSPCSRHATNDAPTGKRFSGPRPRRRLRGAERPGRRGRLGAPCQLGSRAGSWAHTGQRSLAEGFRWARARQTLGDRVLRPFLQDTIRWWPLTVTMAGMLLAAPLTIARVLPQARPARAPCRGGRTVAARPCDRGQCEGWARVLVWSGARFARAARPARTALLRRAPNARCACPNPQVLAHQPPSQWSQRASPLCFLFGSCHVPRSAVTAPRGAAHSTSGRGSSPTCWSA